MLLSERVVMSMVVTNPHPIKHQMVRTWQLDNILIQLGLNLTYKNIIRKREKYKNLIKDLKSDYSSVKFINLSMSSLGVLSAECSTSQDMLNDIGINEKQQRYIIRKMINFAIRATYYIFCCRNKNWDNPELLKF